MSQDETLYQSERFLTVRQLAEHPRYSWLTESAVRHLIHDAEPRLNSLGEQVGGNGLGVAIFRLGRRVLINTAAFDSWIESHRTEFPENEEAV